MFAIGDQPHTRREIGSGRLQQAGLAQDLEELPAENTWQGEHENSGRN